MNIYSLYRTVDIVNVDVYCFLIPRLQVEVRAEVRKQKLWALSAQIRDKLQELGVTIEDSKDGTTWRFL